MDRSWVLCQERKLHQWNQIDCKWERGRDYSPKEHVGAVIRKRGKEKNQRLTNAQYILIE